MRRRQPDRREGVRLALHHPLEERDGVRRRPVKEMGARFEVPAVGIGRIERLRTPLGGDRLRRVSFTQVRVSEPNVRFGHMRVGGDRAPRVLRRVPQLVGVGRERESHRVVGRETGERRRVIRLDRNRFFVELARLVEAPFLHPLPHAPSAREVLERLHVASAGGLRRGRRHPQVQRRRHRLR